MTIYLPNFEIDSQKFLYVDIWSLVVSPDSSNVFTAKDNECIVADFCKFFFVPPSTTISSCLKKKGCSL